MDGSSNRLSKIVAWRYQRKEGWGDIWRIHNDPTPPFFETPSDWTLQALVIADGTHMKRAALEALKDAQAVISTTFKDGEYDALLARLAAAIAAREAN